MNFFRLRLINSVKIFLNSGLSEFSSKNFYALPLLQLPRNSPHLRQHSPVRPPCRHNATPHFHTLWEWERQASTSEGCCRTIQFSNTYKSQSVTKWSEGVSAPMAIGRRSVWAEGVSELYLHPKKKKCIKKCFKVVQISQSGPNFPNLHLSEHYLT